MEEIAVDNLSEPLDEKQENSNKLYILALSFLTSIIMTLIMWVSHQSLFESGGLLYQKGFMFKASGLPLMLMLMLHVGSVSALYGISRPDWIDAYWLPPTIVLIIVLVAWHMFDMVKRGDSHSFMTMAFILLLNTLFQLIPAMLSLMKNTMSKIVKGLVVIASISGLFLMYGIYQIWTILKEFETLSPLFCFNIKLDTSKMTNGTKELLKTIIKEKNFTISM